MRISTTFTHDTYLRYLKQTQQSLEEALARMASGKRVRYASRSEERRVGKEG
jgi:flagellin-like hook-associated protein FlgL